VTVTIAVGFRADQPRFPPLLVVLLSSETDMLLASRRVTQSDLSLGAFSSLARGCHKGPIRPAAHNSSPPLSLLPSVGTFTDVTITFEVAQSAAGESLRLLLLNEGLRHQINVDNIRIFVDEASTIQTSSSTPTSTNTSTTTSISMSELHVDLINEGFEFNVVPSGTRKFVLQVSAWERTGLTGTFRPPAAAFPAGAPQGTQVRRGGGGRENLHNNLRGRPCSILLYAPSV